MTTLAKVGRSFGILLLAVTAWLGVRGIGEFSSGATLAQRIAATTHIAYGIAAITGVIGLLMRLPWAKWALWIWAVSATTITATMAPIVWGGAGWMAALLSGAAAIAVCLLIAWLCNLGEKEATTGV